MKTITQVISALLLSTCFIVPALAADKHDHGKHDHGKHHHGKQEEGPNGGRVLTKIEPHLEFLVTKDRKVQIIALTETLKPGKLSGQIITVTCGDRSKPTKLEFKEDDGKLVSTNTLPEGNDFPVSVGIKANADSKIVYEKFNLDLTKCPTCKNQEYACICEH